MPKITDHGGKSPLRCPTCDEYRYLAIKLEAFTVDNRRVEMKAPFFECKRCGDSEMYQEARIRRFVNEAARASPETNMINTPFENKKFERYDKLGFKYDSQDYYYIPGLTRQWEEGYLTPVFFKKDLLLHYNNHADYRIVLASFSNVCVFEKGKRFLYRGLGINRHGNLFGWLGDLYEKLSKVENEEHLYRFRASNIESDHDIISDYYFNQIEANFTRPDNEQQILLLRNKFEEFIDDKYGIRLSKLEIESMGQWEEYKFPIVDERNQVFNAYKKLNSLLTETIQVPELKKVLIDNGVLSSELKGLRSLKLLELFFDKVLHFSDANTLISPLFVLNDLRNLDGHFTDTSFEEKYNSCKRRLGKPLDVNYINFFKAVITSIVAMYDELNKRSSANQ